MKGSKTRRGDKGRLNDSGNVDKIRSGDKGLKWRLNGDSERHGEVGNERRKDGRGGIVFGA